MNPVESKSVHTETATTSSDILSFGQPISWLCNQNCHKIQFQST